VHLCVCVLVRVMALILVYDCMHVKHVVIICVCACMCHGVGELVSVYDCVHVSTF